MTGEASDRLRREIERLPREIEPSRDLWPAVSERLEPRRPRLLSRLWPFSAPVPSLQWGLAAATVLAALVGLTIWTNRTNWAATPTDGDSVAPAVATQASYGARAEIARTEDGVLQARQDLLEAVQLQSENLSPETLAVVEENMRIIDQAIGQIRSALDEDPFNQQLNMLLAAQYQREVELLKRVSGV